jgi:hypothetical protein
MADVSENTANEEDADIEKVVDRLSDRFPTIDRGHVEELAREEQAEFADAPVRDFVPVIVEHKVMEELRTEADPVPLTVDADGAPTVADPRPGDAVNPDPFEVEGQSEHLGLLNGEISDN